MRRRANVGSADYRSRETVPTTVSLWSGEDVTRATRAMITPGLKALSSGLLEASGVHLATTVWTTPTTGCHIPYCYHYVHREGYVRGHVRSFVRVFLRVDWLSRQERTDYSLNLGIEGCICAGSCISLHHAYWMNAFCCGDYFFAVPGICSFC